ncbi:MAG: hypothetical protein LC650_02115 [Actinobacteria bacterium]|nr:hypothetical protein [Actinomycetota bacterium]
MHTLRFLAVLLLLVSATLAGGGKKKKVKKTKTPTQADIVICRLKKNCDWPQLSRMRIRSRDRGPFDVLPGTEVKPGLYINATCGAELDEAGYICANDTWRYQHRSSSHKRASYWDAALASLGGANSNLGSRGRSNNPNNKDDEDEISGHEHDFDDRGFDRSTVAAPSPNLRIVPALLEQGR